jgi:hypothetical protein
MPYKKNNVDRQITLIRVSHELQPKFNYIASLKNMFPVNLELVLPIWILSRVVIVLAEIYSTSSIQN